MEFIVYIAIFSILSMGIITSLVVSMRLYTVAQANHTLQSDGELSMERMIREIRSLDTITTGSSALNTHPGVLTLSGEDASGNPRTVSFSISNGSLVMYENSSLVGSLTSPNVTVTNLVFNRITTGVGEAVKIQISLRTNRAFVSSTSFNSTIILRGAYE